MVRETETKVTGPVDLDLWASTKAPDTEWTAVLVDMFPDGRSSNFCGGICRARYCNEMAAPKFTLPNAPTFFRIDFWATANLFLAVHRIRVKFSSSNF